MTGMGPAQRLRASAPDAIGGAVRVARVVGLAALLWVTASEHHSDGSPRVPAALLVVTAAGWVAWLVCTSARPTQARDVAGARGARRRRRRRRRAGAGGHHLPGGRGDRDGDARRDAARRSRSPRSAPRR